MMIFLHGLEGSSRGTKAAFLRNLYPDIKIPDFTGSLAERMKRLHAVLDGRQKIRLIGSSFGGLMATIFAMDNSQAVERIVLLAPALNFPEFKGCPIKRITSPAWMIIGSHDTVTPAARVVSVAGRIFANLHYQEVDDDHMLARTFRTLDWETMLPD